MSEVFRREWETSYYDSSHDIVTPIVMAITTPATGTYDLGFEIGSNSGCVKQIYEDAAIGVVGTPLVWRSIIRTDSNEDETHPVLVEQGGTYTGGTLLREKFCGWSTAAPERPPKPFTLQQNMVYRVVVTSIANGNDTAVIARLSKHR